MDSAFRQISLEIPSTDISLVEEIAMRMGWKMRSPGHEKTSKTKNNKYSERINYLRSLKGNGISQDEIDNDERLKYLLNK